DEHPGAVVRALHELLHERPDLGRIELTRQRQRQVLRHASELDRVLHSIDSARRVATSATRIPEPYSRTPSSSITVQNGHATASVSAPVSAASRARSTLIW